MPDVIDQLKNIGGISDHDLIVMLVTNVAQLTLEIRDLKSDIISRVAKLETRADSNDIYHAGIPLQDYANTAKWAESVRSNMKLIIPLGIILMSIISAVLGRITQKWLNI